MSQYGRRLYHLPILTSRRADEPAVIRKMRALGAPPEEQPMRMLVKLALERWREDVSKIPVGAVVLDFDGTCCFTHARHLGTDPRVRRELVRLLDEGLLVGLASGRGRSLHADLRAWIPEHLWDRVALGLYNGGLVLGLGESLAPPSAVIPSLLRKVRLACDALVAVRRFLHGASISPGLAALAWGLLGGVPDQISCTDGDALRPRLRAATFGADLLRRDLARR